MQLYLPIILMTIYYLCLIESSVIRSRSFNVQTPMLIGRRGKRASEVVHSCPNMVYCQGDLLDTVQRHRLFKDSKTFVDMSQINDESVTLDNFKKMMESTNSTPTKSQVQTFVDTNFVFVSETESWTPPDFNPSPAFLEKIGDSRIKDFSKSLVSYLSLLGRQITDSVKANPTRHSIIPVPEGFVIPGGRFREIYYWDSYWIVKGLLVSEMYDTVKGMLNNLVYLVKKYGLIPNGSRLYYINRSQPPLFALTVNLYMEYTNDLEWLRTNIDAIETELNFWLEKRTVSLTRDGVSYTLAHYGTDSNTPRPESYAEDLQTCAHCKHEDEQKACYNALKTAAETGWDFSTRWIFDANGGTKANLTSIDSQRVLPVDLNAILCMGFRKLSEFYGKIGNAAKQSKWASQADTWQKTIELFLYNEADGIWYDYDYDLHQHRKYFWPSNFVPLWANCYDLSNKAEHGKKAVEYFQKQGINNFIGGIPTSLEASGEQWDLPNAWPPLQDFVVLGLYNTGYSKAQTLAVTLAHQWISSNMMGYESSGTMYEKYDAFRPGIYGGGGEYEVQVGFGWSNGVALAFIDQFCSGRILSALFNKYVYVTIFSLLPFMRNNISL